MPIKYSFLRQLKTNKPNGVIRNFRFLKIETILLEKKKCLGANILDLGRIEKKAQKKRKSCQIMSNCRHS